MFLLKKEGVYMETQLAELLFPNIDKEPSYYEKIYPKRSEKVVTRFAPSPTGFVHLGSLYAAFLNRMFADQENGIFYVRIEDTDQKREVENGVLKIKEGLDYFNIDVDESPFNEGNYGPYIQSHRSDIYQTYVKDLVKKGLAYPCFCTEEELKNIRCEQESLKIVTGYYGKWAVCRNMSFDEIKKRIENNESYVIRLRTPNISDEKVECVDLIKGSIYFPVNNIDIVLLKSDGLPTYHLAHVIDDHLMHTTHVIRGDEWLSSMPLHLQLASVLGFETPNYVHISPLTKKEGKSIRKLSKRKDPELAISYYQEMGIPVEALKLYFATIANSNFEEWYNQNPTKNISDFNFTFNKMPVGGTLFDIDKLINLPLESYKWVLLDGHYTWTEPTKIGRKKFDYPQKDFWIMIKGYIVRAKEFNNMIKQLKDVNFMGRWIPECTVQTSLFNKEYFCSSAFEFFKKDYYGGVKWRTIDRSVYKISGEVMIPVEKFYRERGNDYSTEDGFGWYKPCEDIFRELGLKYGEENSALYDANNNLICFDTSELCNEELGFVIDKGSLHTFLENNDYKILDSIRRKRIVGSATRRDREVFPMPTFSGVYYYTTDSRLDGYLTKFME